LRAEAYTVLKRVCTSPCPWGRTQIRSTKEHTRKEGPWDSGSG